MESEQHGPPRKRKVQGTQVTRPVLPDHRVRPLRDLRGGAGQHLSPDLVRRCIKRYGHGRSARARARLQEPTAACACVWGVVFALSRATSSDVFWYSQSRCIRI